MNRIQEKTVAGEILEICVINLFNISLFLINVHIRNSALIPTNIGDDANCCITHSFAFLSQTLDVNERESSE